LDLLSLQNNKTEEWVRGLNQQIANLSYG
jgi:hypothetical protein